MKAILKTSREKGFKYQDVEMPKVGMRDVLIKVKAAAICGSDLNFYVWNAAFCEGLIKDLPFIPGHECSGEVVEIGPAVTYFNVGDRVAVETHIPCGHCRQCQIGRPHTCTNMGLFGHNMNGCFAEYTVVNESGVRKVPDALSWEAGAMLEPLGVVVRPVFDAQVAMSTICITGCGPIGQFAISLCSALGASRIFAVDINEKRLGLAKEMGASDLIDAKTMPKFADYIISQTEGLDIFLDASGNVDSIKEGLKSLRYGGKMYMVGQAKHPLTIESPMNSITLKEITIKGTWGRELFSTWEKAENFILSGKIDLNKIITHRFHLREFEKAFEIAKSGEGCKVVLLPD
jgi:threonine 3-dehydrogenase